MSLLVTLLLIVVRKKCAFFLVVCASAESFEACRRLFWCLLPFSSFDSGQGTPRRHVLSNRRLGPKVTRRGVLQIVFIIIVITVIMQRRQAPSQEWTR